MASGFSRGPLRDGFEVASVTLREVKRLGRVLADVDEQAAGTLRWVRLIDDHVLSFQRTLQSQISMLQSHFQWIQRAMDRSNSYLEMLANQGQRQEVSSQTRNHLLEAILEKPESANEVTHTTGMATQEDCDTQP